jgi:hypothetical protein
MENEWYLSSNWYNTVNSQMLVPKLVARGSLFLIVYCYLRFTHKGCENAGPAPDIGREHLVSGCNPAKVSFSRYLQLHDGGHKT